MEKDILKSIRILPLFLTALMGAPVYADTLIVGNKNEHTISFIDLASGDEIRRVSTGKAPHEMAVSPDGAIAVVVSYREAGYMGNSLHVFDIAAGDKLKVIDLGRHTAPHGLKWLGQSSLVAVTTEGSQHLVIADVESGEVTSELSTAQTGSHMVALSPDNSRAYVANIGSGSFTVFDLDEDKKIKTVKAGKGTEAISVTPDGREIWVGNNNSRNVMIFDSVNFERLATIETKGIPIRVEISPEGAHAAVSEADRNIVSIYDVKTREKIKSVDLSEVGGQVPVTLLFDPKSPRLWAATTRAARIVEIHTGDWMITRILKAGEGSDGLGFSPIDLVPEAAPASEPLE